MVKSCKPHSNIPNGYINSNRQLLLEPIRELGMMVPIDFFCSMYTQMTILTQNFEGKINFKLTQYRPELGEKIEFAGKIDLSSTKIWT